LTKKIAAAFAGLPIPKVKLKAQVQTAGVSAGLSILPRNAKKPYFAPQVEKIVETEMAFSTEPLSDIDSTHLRFWGRNSKVTIGLAGGPHIGLLGEGDPTVAFPDVPVGVNY
jgi:hypothetical protein